MKNNKNYDNIYYLDFVEYYIESLYTQKREDILKYLEGKMDVEMYADFLKIAGQIATKKALKLAKELLYFKADKKTRKLDLKIVEQHEVPKNVQPIKMTPELSKSLNDYIVGPAKKEWDSYFVIRGEEKKFDVEYKKTINEFDQVKFLTILSNFLSLLAIYKQKEQLTNLSSLAISWQKDMRQVLSKKYRSKGEQMKAMLRIILGEKADDIHAVETQVEKEKKRYGHRLMGSSSLAVNLNEDLDISRLKQGDYFIETLAMHGRDSALNIVEDRSLIHITIDGEPQQLALRDYYKDNVHRITEKLLNSDDLLDNVLTVYAIKRAQNGDEQAAQVLYNCYVESAQKLAFSFIRSKAESLKTTKFSQSGQLSDDEVKAVALRTLYMLIAGDNPHLLLQFLTEAEKPDVDSLLNRRIHNVFLDSYNTAFLTILSIIQTLSPRIKSFKTQLKNLTYRLKKAVKSDTKVHYALRIFNLSLGEIRAVETYSIAASVGFDTYNLIVYSRHFNSSVYIPNKQSNLTTWLFGAKTGKFNGMLWQKLNDWYKSKTYTKNGKRLVKDEDYAPPLDTQKIDQQLQKGFGSIENMLDDLERNRENWDL